MQFGVIVVVPSEDEEGESVGNVKTLLERALGVLYQHSHQSSGAIHGAPSYVHVGLGG